MFYNSSLAIGDLVNEVCEAAKFCTLDFRVHFHTIAKMQIKSESIFYCYHLWGLVHITCGMLRGIHFMLILWLNRYSGDNCYRLTVAEILRETSETSKAKKVTINYRKFAISILSMTLRRSNYLFMSKGRKACRDVLQSSSGFQWYNFLGIQFMSMRCRWPYHCRRLFLMTDDSWGCLVLDLMVLFVTCWDHIILRILRWQRMSKASSLLSSLSVSDQHSAEYRSVERTQAL